MSSNSSRQNKYTGSLVGLAVGDTLGMPIEFAERGFFEPVSEPRDGGPFDLPLGYWTDDTSMALCLADSLIERAGYDSYDVMDKYWAWFDRGYRSSLGMCFDIGNQTSAALNEYMTDGEAIVPNSKVRLSSAGNGSIMRLAPIAIASHTTGNTLEKTMELSQISGRETHFSYMAEAGTALFGALLYNAFDANDKTDIFNFGTYKQNEEFTELIRILKLAQQQTAETLQPTGYVVDSLVCALWAFMNFPDFESGSLAAVNLGGDSDTIGAIYGQLAGAYYGSESIPQSWRDVLFQEKDISSLAEQLSRLKSCDVLRTRFEEDGDMYKTEYKITALKADITTLKVDAIVNAANTKLHGGTGVCGAIFDAAGYEDMTDACAKIGRCEYGDAVITSAFKLPSKYVIHTVGPIYGQHDGAEADVLMSCYFESLRAAENKRLESIAFPLISTGLYGYPKQDAIEIAVDSIKQFFEDSPHTTLQDVRLVAFNDNDLAFIQQSLEA